MKIKRLLAYILDYMFIMFFLGLVSQIRIINPYYDRYLDSFEKYEEVVNKMTPDNVLDIVKSKEFNNNYQDVIKYNVYFTITYVIVFIGYFGAFQKWNNGQTLGKKILKIRVVDKDGKKNTNWLRMLLRSIILYNLIFEVINVSLAFLLPNNYFAFASIVLRFLSYTVNSLCLLFVLFRKDGRGLHDILSGTEVI